MRRENKLALIVGFSVLLVVAVLVSDHLSQARLDEVGDGLLTLPDLPNEALMINAPLATEERVPAPPVVVETSVVDVAPGESSLPRVAEARPDVIVPPPLPWPEDVSAGRGTGAGTVEELVIESPRLGGEDRPSDRPSEGGGSGWSDWRAWLPGSPSEDGGASKREGAGEGRDRVDAGRETASAGSGSGPAREYIVRKGDSMFQISERLLGDGTRWREVAALNPGRVTASGGVNVGVRLKMPAGGGGTVERSAERAGERAAGEAKGAEPARAAAQGAFYVVQAGDTLLQISQRELGSSRRVGEIRAINPSLKASGDRIVVGQRLALPGGASARPETAGRSPAGAEPARVEPAGSGRSGRGASGGRVYIVKAGDTLSLIAQRELGSARHIDALRAANPAVIEDEDRIVVGQRLVLPRVTSGSGGGR